MKPVDLVLHCLAEKRDEQWQAICLDFCLAAQGDSFVEVRDKLTNMIGDYLYDALEGEDREYAEQFLFRRAPLRDWIKYYWYASLCQVGVVHNEMRRLFRPTMPLVPRVPRAA
ncbi:MAG: hypothetical protein ACT4NU_09365 [Chromatiales bacterium]